MRKPPIVPLARLTPSSAQVLVVVFGQELPDQAASVWDQVFSLVVACVGLGAFALVLALVEQVVLEVSALCTCLHMDWQICHSCMWCL